MYFFQNSSEIAYNFHCLFIMNNLYGPVSNLQVSKY